MTGQAQGFLRSLTQAVPADCLLLPSDGGFATARLVYNRMHDCHPAAIVRSLDPSVLTMAVSAARAHDIPIAVRGGGHHIGGFSTIDDGLLIDLSVFRRVSLDQVSGVARVEPGARLADLDRALKRHGRFVPSGTVSETGITGLTLGGGIGWLVCRDGLTCDYLHSATVLLADGQLVHASESEHADLLWALRGGGVGAFGIVLELRFSTLELPRIIAGSVTFGAGDADRVLAELQDIHRDAPLLATSLAPVMQVNAGHPVLSVDLCCAQPGGAELDRIRARIGGDWTGVRERRYTQWQSAFDSQYLPPKRGYWKSVHFGTLHLDPAVIAEAMADAPSPGCTGLIEFYNRETLRAAASASAFPLRYSVLGVLLSARWADSSADIEHMRWARRWAAVLRENGGGVGYSNYSGTDEGGIQQGYDSEALRTFERLERTYDPAKVFRRGHRETVVPAARS